MFSAYLYCWFLIVSTKLIPKCYNFNQSKVRTIDRQSLYGAYSCVAKNHHGYEMENMNLKEAR